MGFKRIRLYPTLLLFLLMVASVFAQGEGINNYKQGKLDGWEAREHSTALKVAADNERGPVMAVDYRFDKINYSWWRYWFRPTMDASENLGIVFWLKGDGSGNIFTPTLVFWEGGSELKYNGEAISLDFNGWKQFKVPFEQFILQGKSPGSKLEQLGNIMFNLTASGQNSAGTIYIDEVGFYGHRSINEKYGLIVTDEEPSELEILTSFESLDSWRGSSLSLTQACREQTETVGRWQLSAGGEQIWYRGVSSDLSAFTGLGLWVWSERRDESEFELVLSADSETLGWDYYHAHVKVDWEGWKLVQIPWQAFKAEGAPLGLDKVEFILLSTRGWGQNPIGDAVLLLDKLFLYRGGPALSQQTKQVAQQELPPIPEARGGLVVDDFQSTQNWSGRGLDLVTTGDNNALVWELTPGKANFSSRSIDEFALKLNDYEQLEFDLLVDSQKFSDFYLKLIDPRLTEGYQSVWKVTAPEKIPTNEWRHLTFDLHHPEDRWGDKPDLSGSLIEFRIDSTSSEPVRIYLANLRLTRKYAVAQIVARDVKENNGKITYTCKIQVENKSDKPWVYYCEEATTEAGKFSCSINPAAIFVDGGECGEVSVELTVGADRRQELTPFYSETRLVKVEGMQGDERVGFSFPLRAGNLLPPKTHPLLFFTAEDTEGILSKTERFPEAGAKLAALLEKAEVWKNKKIEIPQRGGQWTHWYSCPQHGVRLETVSAVEHRCPIDGRIFTGEPYDSVVLTSQHSDLGNLAKDLALAYSFSGEEAYAQKVKEILLGYAEKYPHYQLHDTNGLPSKSGGKAFSQTLDESAWLIPIAWAYDLIYNHFTVDERAQIENNLLRPAVDVIQKNDMGVSNWQSWHNAAIGAVGFILRDAGLVYDAIEGESGFKFQMDHSVQADGFWYEGAWGYHFYALDPLLYLAEVAYKNGMDLYCGQLKKMFDAPLMFMMPDFTLPAFNDSDQISVLGYASRYELAYARYQDPTYKQILSKANRTTEEALLYGEPLTSSDDFGRLPSSNFPISGFSMLRVADNYVALDYGPHGDFHGHFDKLGFINYGLGSVWGVDPGAIAYGVPLYTSWYKQTVSHNTVVVDERSQQETTGELRHFFATPLFALAQADADGANPGTKFSRLLAQTDNYLLFFDNLNSDADRQYDWVYHSYGDLDAKGALTKQRGALGIDNGYQHIEQLKRGNVVGSIDASWSRINLGIRLLMAEAEGPSELILANGPGNPPDRLCPLVMVRRIGRTATFAGILEPYVDNSKIVAMRELSLGSGNSGFEIEHESGMDYFVYSQERSLKEAQDFKTDAQIAFIANKDDLFQANLINGTSLVTRQMRIELDGSSDLHLAKLEDNHFFIFSQGKESRQAKLLLPFSTSKVEVYSLNDNYERVERCRFHLDGKELSMKICPNIAYEITTPGQDSAASLFAKLMPVQNDLASDYPVRELSPQVLAEAEKPKQVKIQVEAEAYLGEGGGQIEVCQKVGAVGKSFRMWDNKDHWLQWKFSVPSTGLYKIGFRYCTDLNGASRSLLIDKEYPQGEFKNIIFPNTHGWSSTTSDWQNLIVSDDNGEPIPVYLEAGEHELRMYNTSGGGINLDYLVILSLDEEM